MTQRDLAAKLRKPPSYVHKTEVGERRIDPVELVLWCRACHVKTAIAMAEVDAQV